MDIVNPDKEVFKRIHRLGNETCLKTVDRVSTEKSTVFISSSVGCPLKCKFCHLSIGGVRHQPIEVSRIVRDTVDTIRWAMTQNESIRNKRVKLSFMGMGDALTTPKKFSAVVHKLVAAIDELGAKGLDSIDVSTAFPFGSHAIDELADLQETYGDSFRVFYSLFSTIQHTRDFIIPNTRPFAQSIALFRAHGIRVIAQHPMLEGINDTDAEIDSMVAFVNDNADAIKQLRILRYNPVPESLWVESLRYDEIVNRLEQEVTVPLKLQISPGEEIKAACGMFHVEKPD